MFLALIAFGVSLIVKLRTKSKKTPWVFFRILRTYLFLPGKEMLKEINRKTKKSKGRQKVPIPLEKEKPSFGSVALVIEKVKKEKRKNERKLGNY
jgi:hypothetical protein